MAPHKKYYYVYIMTNRRNGTLYVGVTGDLGARVYEHKNHQLPGFTDKYNCDMLVYYERFEYINDAIAMEKRLKRWHREWKIALIERANPQWCDLYETLNMVI